MLRSMTMGEAPATGAAAPDDIGPYWAVGPEAVLARVGSSREGLSRAEAARRLRVYGANQIRDHARFTRARVLANQFRNPLLLVLVFAAVASAATSEWIDASIVLIVVVATVGVGYAREYSAQAAAAALQARVRSRARVVRDGQEITIPHAEVVPGDVVQLSAGSIVPADGALLDATDFFVSEAVLTGESFPVEKHPGSVPLTAPLHERVNCVFLGTNVRSGAALYVVAATGLDTQYGAIAHRLTLRPPETEFDRGIRRFGYLLTSTMIVMVGAVFIVHVAYGRAPIETLLFAVALAVGLSPELLPAILSVNLARGAQMMARRGVLVRRLNAIENLGSMDVLCTDKTGTITQGVVSLEGAYDAAGIASSNVRRLAAINAALETGLHNPLDDAILAAGQPHLAEISKVAEVPFDFVRKRVSVIVDTADGRLLVTKGAFAPVLEVCTTLPDGTPLDERRRSELERSCEALAARGMRTVAVATRRVRALPANARDIEDALTFEGYLAFLDEPKDDAREAIDSLARLGVSIKIITGDSKAVTQHVASMVGLSAERVLTGAELQDMSDEALWHKAERTDLFVEVDPNEKERIILAFKKMGHVVGFLGDGVNDAPGMHAADTSLSVDQAVDVAREAADFVLLERSLQVISRGIEEGRVTFANTLKYILTTMSANLGNMISMAAASLVLPFLPLLAGQILLNNFLSDVPAVGLATDAVDVELVERPMRWNMRFIARYMVEFGALSSVFDVTTFAVLLVGFQASADLFRTGWFVESLLTELVIALVVRTRRPFFRSRPGSVLLWSTVGVSALTVAMPYLPFAGIFGFVRVRPVLIVAVVAITGVYVAAAELLKRWFYRGTLQPVLEARS